MHAEKGKESRGRAARLWSAVMGHQRGLSLVLGRAEARRVTAWGCGGRAHMGSAHEGLISVRQHREAAGDLRRRRAAARLRARRAGLHPPQPDTAVEGRCGQHVPAPAARHHGRRVPDERVLHPRGGGAGDPAPLRALHELRLGELVEKVAFRGHPRLQQHAQLGHGKLVHPVRVRLDLVDIDVAWGEGETCAGADAGRARGEGAWNQWWCGHCKGAR